MTNPGDDLLDGMKTLSPTAFEHLIFDLMILTGLRNVVWRSPGADGGRDIEGDFLTVVSAISGSRVRSVKTGEHDQNPSPAASCRACCSRG